MEFNGKVPCNSIETTHRLFHGSPWSFMEFTGIRHLKHPVNQMEYITDFGPMQFISSIKGQHKSLFKDIN